MMSPRNNWRHISPKLRTKIKEQQKSFEEKLVDFAAKMDTKLNKMLDRVEGLSQELHIVKDAVAVHQIQSF